MALLRKKKSTFDESDLPTDNWIWGNTRGGGGAPLKDVQGNDVANLKKVLTGTIEVDHSPSPNGKARRNTQSYRETEYDDRDGGYNSKQNPRNPQNNAPKRNVDNRNRQGGYDQYSDEEFDRRGSRNDNNNNNRNNNERNSNNNNKPRYNPYSDEAPERIIPGLNDHRSPVHHTNNSHRNQNNPQNEPVSPRYVNNNNGASPKKFMGALRELTGGSNAERDAKQRKQAEYQEMLRQQIEDNNRKKEKEKREQDEVKRRELAEFMSTQGQKNGGKATSAADESTTGTNKRNPVQGRFRAESDEEYNNNNNHVNEKMGSKMPSLNLGAGNATKRGGNNDVDGHGGYNNDKNRNSNYYSDEEQEGPPVRRGQGGADNKGRHVPGIATNRRASSYDSDSNQDYPPRRGHGNNNNTGGGYDSEGSVDSRNAGGRGGRGGKGPARGRGSVTSAMSEDVVPVEEYDELSKLVDRLLTEKAQLQMAVDKQADQLKALKGGKAAPSTNPRSRLVSSPSKPALARSRSAMQPRAGGARGREQPDLSVDEPPARAASNLRTSKKELDRERAKEARAHLKEYEPIKKNAIGADAKNRARPSSMHAIGASKGYTDDSGQPKKAVKVAFGSNRNLDKNNSGAPNRLAQQGASVLNAPHGTNNKARGSPSKDNTAQGRYGVGNGGKGGRVSAGGGGMGERDNIGINGFAKLQQANSRIVGGPVMVVHDEEEPSGRGYNSNSKSHGNNYGDSARTPSPLQKGRGGNARVGSLELRGNSEYIPIDNNKDVIGNDQLERLLRQSRNAR